MPQVEYEIKYLRSLSSYLPSKHFEVSLKPYLFQRNLKAHAVIQESYSTA